MPEWFVVKRRVNLDLWPHGKGPIFIREAKEDEIKDGDAVPITEAFREAKRRAKWTAELPGKDFD